MAVVDPTTGGVEVTAAEVARRRTLQRDRGYFTEGKRVLMRRAPMTHKGVLDQPFFFQVPPLDELTISSAFNFTDYTNIARITLSRPDAAALRTLTVNSMFLDWEASFAVHHRGEPARPDRNPDTVDTRRAGIDVTSGVGMAAFRDSRTITRNVHFMRPRSPLYQVDRLRAVLMKGTPFWLYVGDVEVWGRWDLRMLATLRQLDVSDRAGEPDTRYISAQFVEYRRPRGLSRDERTPKYHPKLPLRVRVYEDGYWSAPGSIDTRHRDAPPTLHNLATLYYGSPGKWRLIAKANGITNWPASKDLKLLAQERTKRKLGGHGGHITLLLPKGEHEADKGSGVRYPPSQPNVAVGTGRLSPLWGEVLDQVDAGWPGDTPDVEGGSGGFGAP